MTSNDTSSSAFALNLSVTKRISIQVDKRFVIYVLASLGAGYVGQELLNVIDLPGFQFSDMDWIIRLIARSA